MAANSKTCVALSCDSSFKLELHGTSFPRSILVTSSRGCLQQVVCVKRVGCQDDAARKPLSWNLAFTVSSGRQSPVTSCSLVAF